MSRLIGFKKSTFDPERYRQSTNDNHGEKPTTEGILAGMDALNAYMTEHPEHDWLTAMKETAAYISPIETQ